MFRAFRSLVVSGALIAGALVLVPQVSAYAAAPTSPPVSICGNSSVLTGPSTAPAGSTTIPAGDNSSFLASSNTTYYVASGTHNFLTAGQFGQIIPQPGDKFIGAPGAIIDGENISHAAFTQTADHVTIQYLTIQNFAGIQDEGVVNHDSGDSWIIANDTIQDNTGAGMMSGKNQWIVNNCIRHNDQLGIDAYQVGNGLTGILIYHNEITDNAYNGDPGCGCTGGLKLWWTNDTNVLANTITLNGSTGIWADTNNRGTQIDGNYIALNAAEGIFYEISYNAKITNNFLYGNGLVKGPTNPTFPTGAIYISESGADSRVGDRYQTSLDISSNVINSNWAGVVLWEKSDRSCGQNPMDTTCTLVNPTVATPTTCANATLIQTTPYINDCRWKTQNVSVHDNTITNLSTGYNGCSFSTGCNYEGLMSDSGSQRAPYLGQFVENNITFNQNNLFDHNAYHGILWSFMPHEAGLGNRVGLTTWRTTYGQDVNSTFVP